MSPLPGSFCMTETVVRWYISSSLGPNLCPRDSDGLGKNTGKQNQNKYSVDVQQSHSTTHIWLFWVWTLQREGLRSKNLFMFFIMLRFTKNWLPVQRGCHVAPFECQNINANRLAAMTANSLRAACAMKELTFLLAWLTLWWDRADIICTFRTVITLFVPDYHGIVRKILFRQKFFKARQLRRFDVSCPPDSMCEGRLHQMEPELPDILDILLKLEWS